MGPCFLKKRKLNAISFNSVPTWPIRPAWSGSQGVSVNVEMNLLVLTCDVVNVKDKVWHGESLLDYNCRSGRCRPPQRRCLRPVISAVAADVENRLYMNQELRACVCRGLFHYTTTCSLVTSELWKWPTTSGLILLLEWIKLYTV